MLPAIRRTAWVGLALGAALVLLPIGSSVNAAKAEQSSARNAQHAISHKNSPPWNHLSPGTRKALMRQIPLLNAASRLKRLIGRRYRANYNDVGIDIPTDRVLLFWKGSTLPEQVRSYLADLPVKHSVRHVKYSRVELDSAKHSLMQTGRIIKAMTRPDHSGIEATARPGTRPSISRAQRVPVDIKRTGRAKRGDCTPFAPCPPYQGGTFLAVDIGNSEVSKCTSSWRVLDSNDNEGLLTAAHCGTDLSDNWIATGHVYSGAGDEIATSVSHYGYSVDAMVITGKSPYYGGFYDTAWNDPAEWSVTDYRDPIFGQKICSMGAFSGGDCAFNVTDDSCIETYGPRFQDVQGFCMSEQNGEYAVGEGDSGGPFYYPGDGVWDTYAVGIYVSSEDLEYPCWSKSKPDRGPVCANNAMAVPLSRILDEFDLGLLTS